MEGMWRQVSRHATSPRLDAMAWKLRGTIASKFASKDIRRETKLIRPGKCSRPLLQMPQQTTGYFLAALTRKITPHKKYPQVNAYPTSFSKIRLSLRNASIHLDYAIRRHRPVTSLSSLRLKRRIIFRYPPIFQERLTGYFASCRRKGFSHRSKKRRVRLRKKQARPLRLQKRLWKRRRYIPRIGSILRYVISLKSVTHVPIVHSRRSWAKTNSNAKNRLNEHICMPYCIQTNGNIPNPSLKPSNKRRSHMKWNNVYGKKRTLYSRYNKNYFPFFS